MWSGKWRKIRRQSGYSRSFRRREVIDIDHYKDVFCRSRQDYVRQHAAQNLILAAKHGELLYPGAPVCQNFGNEHFTTPPV